MSKTPVERPSKEAVAALVNRALADGTHGDVSGFRTVCHVCRQWVSGIWWVNEQGTRMCRGCSPKDKQ
jgi:hypothetical protein